LLDAPPRNEDSARTMAFGIYQLYRLLGQDKFRQRRAHFFVENYGPEPSTKILDVGGFFYVWNDVPIQSPITFVNIDYPPDSQVNEGRFTSEIGDGCALRFADQSFDIGYSNSVIEHITTFEAQEKFAREIRRVGKKIFVQTPNRWFPVEPHFIAPFTHFLPWKIARRLLPILSLRGIWRRGENKNLRHLADELRYLSYREMKQLFPDCEIYREKVFGMTKSFIAMRR
jgi:hypothetical protein